MRCSARGRTAERNIVVTVVLLGAFVGLSRGWVGALVGAATGAAIIAAFAGLLVLAAKVFDSGEPPQET